jgi:hypothetical protein
MGGGKCHIRMRYLFGFRIFGEGLVNFHFKASPNIYIEQKRSG